MKHFVPTGGSAFGKHTGDTYLLNMIGVWSTSIAISLLRVCRLQPGCTIILFTLYSTAVASEWLIFCAPALKTWDKLNESPIS